MSSKSINAFVRGPLARSGVKMQAARWGRFVMATNGYVAAVVPALDGEPQSSTADDRSGEQLRIHEDDSARTLTPADLATALENAPPTAFTAAWCACQKREPFSGQVTTWEGSAGSVVFALAKARASWEEREGAEYRAQLDEHKAKVAHAKAALAALRANRKTAPKGAIEKARAKVKVLAQQAPRKSTPYLRLSTLPGAPTDADAPIVSIAYLETALRALNAKQVRIRWTGALLPVILDEGGVEDSVAWIVMPMRA